MESSALRGGYWIAFGEVRFAPVVIRIGAVSHLASAVKPIA